MEAKRILGDALKVIEKFAPSIAGFIFGAPVGMATDLIVTLLKRTFNIPSDEPSIIQDHIMSDPACDVKLCALEEKYGELFKGWFTDKKNQPEINVLKFDK